MLAKQATIRFNVQAISDQPIFSILQLFQIKGTYINSRLIKMQLHFFDINLALFGLLILGKWIKLIFHLLFHMAFCHFSIQGEIQKIADLFYFNGNLT